MTVSPTAICPTLSARVCWHTPWPLIRPHCVLRPRQPARAPGSVTKPSTKPEVNTHGHHVRGQSMFDLVLVTSRPRQASFTASTIVQWPVDLHLAPLASTQPRCRNRPKTGTNNQQLEPTFGLPSTAAPLQLLVLRGVANPPRPPSCPLQLPGGGHRGGVKKKH